MEYDYKQLMQVQSNTPLKSSNILRNRIEQSIVLSIDNQTQEYLDQTEELKEADIFNQIKQFDDNSHNSGMNVLTKKAVTEETK